MNSWLEWAIVLFIVVGIAIAIWKGGSANPEGTGALRRSFNRLDGDVKGLTGQVTRTGERVAAIERKVTEECASTKDIETIEQKIETLRTEVRGDRELAQRTYASVKRIEDFLIEKGLGGR